MATVVKDLGAVTAYAYAVAGGYSGTEAEFEALLGNIAEDLSEIENLSVTVTTLPAGSSATASYNNGVLSLGIPKGDKGDKGDTGATGATGPQGIPGDVANLASAYSTSSTYGVGDYCIYNSQLYRCTTAITTAEAWTAGHWTATVLGNDVSDLKSAVNAIFSVDFSENGYINTNGANSGTSTAFRRTDYIPLSGVLFGVEYALRLDSDGNIVSYYDENKKYLDGVAGAGNHTTKTGMLVYPDTAKYVRFSYCKASAGITNPDPVVRLKDIAQYSDVGYKAVKTPNIGDNAVTKKKCDFIIHDPETNYIEKSEYSNGYIGASGVFVSNTGWRATGFCALLPETQYFSSGLHGGYCAFYKADKTTVIAGYGANAFTVTNFTTPAETAYARFSLNASSQSVDTAWINIKNEKPADYGYLLDGVGISSNVDNPCDYDGREIAVFNKILCVGDSMTEGTFNHLDSGSTQYVSYAKYSYPTYLHKLTGVDVTNLGHGGQTSVQWYNTEQSNDLSGYDCAIIQLGINDVGTYTTWGSNSEDAFSSIITKLKTQNKNIKIFVANIIPATSYSSSDYKDFSDDMLDWLETEYASDSSVIPLDIQRYGHTGDSSAYNCGHLSALGYHRLAEDYNNYISWYINQNKDVFREVQFIGTDYWYVNPNS